MPVDPNRICGVSLETDEFIIGEGFRVRLGRWWPQHLNHPLESPKQHVSHLTHLEPLGTPVLSADVGG